MGVATIEAAAIENGGALEVRGVIALEAGVIESGGAISTGLPALALDVAMGVAEVAAGALEVAPVLVLAAGSVDVAGPPLAIVSGLEIAGTIIEGDGAIAVVGTIAVDVAALTAEGPSTDPTAVIVIQSGSLDLVGPPLNAERPIVAWAHRMGTPAALTIALEAAEPLQRQLANSML